MFSHPVYFVHHGLDRWDDICAPEVPPHPDAYSQRLHDGNDNWVLQTYLELKHRHLNVHIVRRPVPGAICVAHYDDIWLKDKPIGSFLVGVRADRPAIAVGEMTVVQNQHAMRPGRDFFLPHWSQPGLMPRDPSRGTAIRSVGYMGMRFNLHPEFRDGEFERDLAQRGVTLIVREYPFTDYRDLDLILAVRPGTRYDIDLKPASKLQNAWLAGCPALLGLESGYRQYRRSELDYIEVASPAQALDAIDRLKQDPDRYTRMVENGRVRGADYTHEAIAQRWIEFLAERVIPAYERWRITRPYIRWFDPPRFAIQAACHKINRYRHRRSI